jgi:hypothetical protein
MERTQSKPGKNKLETWCSVRVPAENASSSVVRGKNARQLLLRSVHHFCGIDNILDEDDDHEY